MEKMALLSQLRAVLEAELEVLVRSATAAKDAATHAENKPENKYDTRGLEASYLAGAQEGRAAELRRDIALLDKIPLRTFGPGDKIAATALVTVEKDGAETTYFVMPVGGGSRLNGKDGPVIVVTPQAPLVRAMQEGRETVEVVAVS